MKEMKIGQKIEVAHPKCKEVKGTIEKVINSVFPEDIYEVTTFYGYQDWYSDFNEAKKYLEKNNEAEYNGSAQTSRANNRAYANHERSMFNF